jgi:hypothetical protein
MTGKILEVTSRSSIGPGSPGAIVPDYRAGFFDRNDGFLSERERMDRARKRDISRRKMFALPIVHPKHAVLGRSVLAKR